MRTIRSAAAALANASFPQSLGAIAIAMGFAADHLPLDASARGQLGLPPDVVDARIARGPGDLRAVLGEVSGAEDIRNVVARIARFVSTRAPHLLCVVFLTERNGHHVVIATWSRTQTSLRIAALVVDRDRVLDSDAETICALVAAADTNDVLTHIRWLEVLGRESLTRRFYTTLRGKVISLGSNATGPGDAEEKQEIALLYVSRLLFLSFIEAKGWLDNDRAFLVHSFEKSNETGGAYQQRVLRPLFFGTLNTRVTARAPAARKFGRVPFLNGGLFTPTPLERRLRSLRFSDEDLGGVFADLLGRYRFTAREDSTAWSEAAIDPEMLGKAFESLMAGEGRKDSGAFYTPQSLVENVTRSALVAALASPELSEDSLRSALDCAPLPDGVRAALATRLKHLTVLDPACGSGAFLVHMLAELSRLIAYAGDQRSTAEIRRSVLADSIFGVDVNRTAVWLCELRLWLAVVIEADDADPLRVAPLPNLDHHIRIGDTLLGGAFTDNCNIEVTRSARALTQLRVRYARSSGKRKQALARAMDRVERASARRALDASIIATREQRRELLLAHRGRDLFGDRRRPHREHTRELAVLRQRVRALQLEKQRLDDGAALPFSFATHFSDIAANGGFDIVVGNPPWVRIHRIPPRTRALLREQYVSFRNAAWRPSGAGDVTRTGFASQIDLAALFAERSIALLAARGVLAMLLPAKLWRSLAGGGIRALIRARCSLLLLEDWTDSPALFDAAVYPSLLVARRERQRTQPAQRMRLTTTVGTRSEAWYVSESELGLTSDAAAPWLLLPPDARRAFRTLMESGVPLREAALGRPTLGVKCGYNEAFVVSRRSSSGALTEVSSGARTGFVETELLRPVLRGSDIRAWSTPTTGLLLWTHDGAGRPMKRLPRYAAQWLSTWRSELAKRSDARRVQRWWSLFRTEGASNDKARVVWSDFGKRPRASVLLAGDPAVPLNTCYVCRCTDVEDAFALCTLLNSPLSAAWLNAIAEPARGGFHRYLAWTVGMLPLPPNWRAARAALAPIAADALGGRIPDDKELLSATIEAFDVRREEVLPLVEWMSR